MYLKRIVLFPTALLVFVYTLTFCLAAAASEGRKLIITKELECVSVHLENNQELGWGDVCYTNAYARQNITMRQKQIEQALDDVSQSSQPMQREQREYRPIPSSYKITAGEDKVKFYVEAKKEVEIRQPIKPKRKAKKPADQSGVFSNKDKRSKLDFGIEAYFYKYDEPTWGTVVRLDGEFYGFFSSYAFRFFENQPINSFTETFSSKSKVNMVRFEGRATWGETDYDGSVKYHGISDYTFELRGMLGYDIPLKNEFLATPYMGFGYRYLFDGFSEVPNGYDRESRYYYLPMGIDIAKDLKNGWSLETNFEYDLFLWGKQVSHLEDVNMSDSSLINKQDQGYGIRGSFRAVKQTDNLAFFLEPFIRYWNIEDSKISSSALSSGQEPKNDTTEWGLRLGIRY